MSKKIVIVEDEEAILEMYKMKFAAEGFEVVGAADGEAGLKAVKEAKPDLVLLDIMMPKMDGYEVLRQIRADEDIKGTKVFLLTNLGQSTEVEKGTKEGADGYLIKSNMTPTELAKKVKEILN